MISSTIVIATTTTTATTTRFMCPSSFTYPTMNGTRIDYDETTKTTTTTTLSTSSTTNARSTVVVGGSPQPGAAVSNDTATANKMVRRIVGVEI